MDTTLQNYIKMKKFYDDIADKYDLIFSLSPQHKNFFSEEIKGKKILDVGAGTGNLSEYLLEENYEVVSIDINEKLINKARQKGIKILNLSMMDIENLSKFDTIIVVGNTLPHLKDKKEIYHFLEKAYYQLNEGGKLIIQMVNFHKYNLQKDENGFLGNFPLIENENVKFERFYILNNEGNIVFKTILDETIENEEILINIEYQELMRYFQEIGFRNIQIYGGFNKVEFNPENSMPVIITGEK